MQSSRSSALLLFLLVATSSAACSSSSGGRSRRDRNDDDVAGADGSATPDAGEDGAAPDGEDDGTPAPDTMPDTDVVEPPDTIAQDTDTGPRPCDDHADCPGGHLCDAGVCTEVCGAGDPCTGSLLVCDLERRLCVQCLVDGDCATGLACADHVCVDGGCDRAEDCGEGEFCDRDTGECLPGECTDDSDCAGGEICTLSRCVRIVDVICDPDETQCDGDVLLACNEIGTEWDASDCGPDGRCDDSGPAATCIAWCASDDRGCYDPDSGWSCNDGTGQLEDFTCGGGTVCTGGACAARICSPGGTRCQGNVLLTCNSLGTSESMEDCGDLICSDSGCATPVCTPGSLTCRTGDSWRCLPDGSDWEFATECGASGCSDGRCTNPCLDTGRADTGCEFWAVDLNNESSADSLTRRLHITNRHTSTVDVVMYNSAGTAVTSGSMAPGASGLFPLANTGPTGSSLSNSGYRVSSTGPIGVAQINPEYSASAYTADGSTLWSSAAWGTEYFAIAAPPASASVSLGGFVVAVATSTGTTRIDVTPTYAVRAGSGVPAIGAGSTTSFTLTRGQVLALEATETSGADLTGTRLVGDRPFAVFGGSECAQVPNGTVYCDHLEEQLLPVSLWGTEYVGGRFHPRGTEVDVWRVVAAENGTLLQTTPALPGANGVSIDRGEFVEFQSTGSFVLTSSRPVELAHYMAGAGAAGIPVTCDVGTGIGDPSLEIVFPSDMQATSYAFTVPSGYQEHWVTVTHPLGATVRLDGSTAGTATPIPGTTWATRTIAVTTGRHELTSSTQMGAALHGYDCDVSYSWALGGIVP